MNSCNLTLQVGGQPISVPVSNSSSGCSSAPAAAPTVPSTTWALACCPWTLIAPRCLLAVLSMSQHKQANAAAALPACSAGATPAAACTAGCCANVTSSPLSVLSALPLCCRAFQSNSGRRLASWDSGVAAERWSPAAASRQAPVARRRRLQQNGPVYTINVAYPCGGVVSASEPCCPSFCTCQCCELEAPRLWVRVACIGEQRLPMASCSCRPDHAVKVVDPGGREPGPWARAAC